MVNGSKQRDHLFSFFEQRSPEASYILGAFFSNGSVYKNNTSYYVQMVVKISLKPWLYEMWKLMHPLPPLEDSTVSQGERSRLRFTSREVAAYLADRGFHPNFHQYASNFPDLEKKELGHFLRGYFDGKGLVEPIMDGTSLLVSFEGRQEFLIGMMKMLKEYGILDQDPTKRHPNVKNSAFVLQWMENRDVLRLYQLMYGNSDAKLLCRGENRKVFEDYIEWLKRMRASLKVSQETQVPSVSSSST